MITLFFVYIILYLLILNCTIRFCLFLTVLKVLLLWIYFPDMITSNPRSGPEKNLLVTYTIDCLPHYNHKKNPLIPPSIHQGMALKCNYNITRFLDFSFQKWWWCKLGYGEGIMDVWWEILYPSTTTLTFCSWQEQNFKGACMGLPSGSTFSILERDKLRHSCEYGGETICLRQTNT